MLAAVKDAGGDRPSTALAADTGVDYDDAAYEREMKAARRQAAADRLAVIQRLNLIAYVNAAVLARSPNPRKFIATWLAERTALG